MATACMLQHHNDGFAVPASQLSESTPLLILPTPKWSDVIFNLLWAKKKKPMGDEYTTPTSSQNTAHHRAFLSDSQISDPGPSQSPSRLTPAKETSKKIAGGNEDGSGDGDDDDGDPDNSRKASAANMIEPPLALLACPFTKRFQDSILGPRCSGGFKTASNVK